MLSANDVVTKARMSLGDISAERWDDTRLLDLVDEAQKDVCLHTHLYRREGYIPLIIGQYIYDLPADTLIVHRVQSLNTKLPFTTKDDMDSKSMTWRDDVADTVDKVMKDSIPMNQIEVYPIPSGDMFYIPTYEGLLLAGDIEITLLDTEGVWSDMVFDGESAPTDKLGVFTGVNLRATLTMQLPEDYKTTVWGVLVDMYEVSADDTYEINYNSVDWARNDLGVTSEVRAAQGSSDDTSLFGVMAELDPNFGYLTDTWGCIASIIQEGSVLKILYTAVPPSVSTNNAPLILSNIWETALKYYVAGYALLDDNDAGNIARGNEFLKRYQRELSRAMTLSTIEQHDIVGSELTKYQSVFRR